MRGPNLRRLEQRYGARIMQLIRGYEELVRQELFPQLGEIAADLSLRSDDATDLIDTALGKIRLTFEGMLRQPDVERNLRDEFEEINSESRGVHNRQIRQVLGVDPIAAEPWLADEVRAFVRENASLITTLPEETLADIEQLVFREGRRGASVREIRARIIERFEATESRAQLIARDQVSKFNARLTERRQRQAGITSYIWRTSDDARVRDDHRRLDDTVQQWDDPPVTVTSGKRAGEQNHPGQDIQCRCWPEPVFDDLLPDLNPGQLLVRR